MLTVEHMKRLIQEAGRTPVERDTLYRVVHRDPHDLSNWYVGEPVAVAT
jgi:aminodeoxyfutalosine synthase